MNPKRATELLLSGGKLTNRVRKHAMRCREMSMVSKTPIYKEEESGQPTEYFSSKPSEVSDEQRLAVKLRRATREQLLKWTRRNLVREAACTGIAERIGNHSTSDLRRKQKFEALAQGHDAIVTACLAEINRREEKIKSRGN